MKNSDAQLIHRVLNGDDTAFSKLVKKYQKQVHALAWRKIGDFHIAEEITQDTFLKAYQKLRTLKKPQRFASWLYVIAANHCNTWLQKKQSRAQLLKNKGDLRPEKPSYSEYVAEENERISVETQREVVKKLLAKLEESERTVMTLHYFAEMSCTEIGAFLGVSANTIKSRLRRARQRLKQEEPLIKEALDNFQISPNLTESIMREVSRIKPDAPFSGKPLVPWAIAASTLTVVLLMLGFGNHQYLTRFQKPYSFDATSEMTVEIIDAPVVANLESKPGVRTQIGSTNAVGKHHTPEHQPNDAPAATAEAQTEETVKDWTQWELPKEAKARLGKGEVNAIKFTPDGTQLAIGTSIGVWLYDANTGAEIALLTENNSVDREQGRSYINALAFSTDGSTLACGDLDGKIKLWDLETRTLKSILGELPRPVKALQFIAGNTNLVGVGGWTWDSRSGKTLLWNLTDNTQTPIVTALDQTGNESPLEFHVAISPNERFLAVASANAYWRKKMEVPAIQVWDIATEPAQRVFTVEKHSHSIETLVFSQDSKTLAIADSTNGIQLWGIESQKLLSTIKAPTSSHTLAFSPDGSLLASGGTDGTVRLWSVRESRIVPALRRVSAIVSGQRPLRTFKTHSDNSKFTAITFSPDGKKFAAANTDGTVRLLETDSGDQQFTFTQHSGTLSALAFNDLNAYKPQDPSDKPNHTAGVNRTLISLSLRNSQAFVSVWDTDTGSELSTDRVENNSEKTSEAAISPDGSVFATKDINKINFRTQVVRLWDTNTRQLLSTLGDQEDSGFQAQVVFSADSKLLAVSSRKDNTIQIWDVPNRREQCRLEGHTTAVYSLAFSPDNKTVVSSGWTTKDLTIRLWDTMTGTELATFPDQGAVAFAPDGNAFAGGSHIYSRNPTTSTYERMLRLEDMSDPPTALTFSPDGSILVSGSRHGFIQLRDTTTGKIISTLLGHTSYISVLVFSEDQATLATAGKDGTVLLWDWNEVLEGIKVEE